MQPKALFEPTVLAQIARTLPLHRDEVRPAEPEIQSLAHDLTAELQSGHYQPQPARLFRLSKPNQKHRVLAKLIFRDRVVQRGVLRVLRSQLPRLFPHSVCSYVSGRSALDVVLWLEGQLATSCARRPVWAWSLDVIDFFPSIRPDKLADDVAKFVPWSRIRELVIGAIYQPTTGHGLSPGPGGLGLIQGGLLSPWLSNLYLRSVDTQIDTRVTHGPGYRRYCDNLFFVGTHRQLETDASLWTRQLAGLGLRARFRPARPARAEQGLECLGYQITARGRGPSRNARRRFIERLIDRLRRRVISAAHALVRGHRNYFGGQAMDLDNIDELLREGRFREAIERLETERAELASDDSAQNLHRPPSDEPFGDQEDAAELLGALGGDPSRHVAYAGLHRETVSRGLTPSDLDDHRRGRRTLGVLPVDRDGWAHVGVLDVDGVAQAASNRPAITQSYAAQLAGAAHRLGQPTLLEETGGRGHHVWVPLPQPQPAGRATELLETIARQAGDPPAGTRLEIFPAPPDRDPAVRLPLGCHPLTGQRSRLVHSDGRPITERDALRNALRAATPGRDVALDLERHPPAVRRVLASCTILSALARKAAELGDLSHHERFSLAATLAHVPGGPSMVHQIIAWCHNYDYDITVRFLERVAPRPLGCRRLHERHPELAGQCRCPTPIGGLRYPSPVCFARDRSNRSSRTAGPVMTSPSLQGQSRAADLERMIRGLARSLERIRGAPRSDEGQP